MQFLSPLPSLESLGDLCIPQQGPRLLRDSIPEGKGRISPEEFRNRIRKGQRSGMKSMLRLAWKHKGSTFCVVGGGPSLQDNVGELRRLAKRGAIIVAVNKSHDWLLARGLPCHYGVLLDPKEWVADYITVDVSHECLRETKDVVQSRYGTEIDGNLQPVRGGPQPEKSTALPAVQKRVHARMAEDTSADGRTEIEGYRQVNGECLSEARQVDQSAMLGVRRGEIANAPPGLRQAARRGVALPPVSSRRASDDKKSFIARARKRAGKLWVEPSYLIASQCHDDTIAKFRDHPRAYMWHAGSGVGEDAILQNEFAGDEWLNVRGASVVGLRAVSLSIALGAAEVHVFGLDGSSKPPTEAEAREIFAALVDADMTKPGTPTYAEILDVLFELARRRIKLPEGVNEALKKHHYSYSKPHIDPTWCGFTVDLTSGWSRNFMANHHMARSVYEFETAMKHWDGEIRRGSLPPFLVRVHGDPEVSAIAMIAAGMGVHADPRQNVIYGQPPQRKAA